MSHKERKDECREIQAREQKKKLLEGNSVSVRYGDITILDNVSFSVHEGEWLMIVGPNGAGKSTIINAISGEAPYSGQIFLRGRNIREYRPAELARNIGILSQNHYVGYSFTIREVVGLGRYAFRKGLLGGTDEKKEDLVDQALEMTGLTNLQDHSVLQLSGGELQRTFLAQLFAQDPDVLILDEPTNHLDLIYQKQIFALLDRASDLLHTPSLPRNGYYAYVCKACAPTMEYYGYFADARRFLEEAEWIYAGA